MVLAGATLVGSLALMPLVGTEFVPKADYSETFVNFYAPSGTSIEATEARTREVERLIRQMPEVDYTLSTINTGQALGRNQVSVYVRLTDRHLRQRNVDQLSAPLRQALSAVPGVTVTHVGLLDAVAGLKPIMLSIQGSNLKELERLNREALALLRPIPGLVDLDTSLKADKPTLDIRVRRDAGRRPGSQRQRRQPGPERAGRRQGGGQLARPRRAELRHPRLPAPRRPPHRRRPAQPHLGRGHRCPGPSRQVRLSQVADVVEGVGPSQINRRDLNREIEITANFTGRSMGEVSADIRKVLDQMPWPNGYRYRFGGSTKDMQESFAYALSALGLAIVFIYMILASQFRSFLQPHRADELPALTLIGVVAHAAGVRLHRQHVLHHRRRHADGPGHQERHLAGGLCQPRPCRAMQAKAMTAPPCPAAKPCCWPPACACAPSS